MTKGPAVPKPIIQRLSPDSIQGFRAAALVRFDDASRLEENGRGVAAMYLWGYSVEMAIKAAYFSGLGLSAAHPITMTDLGVAINHTAKSLGIAWPSAGRLHNLECWAQLLVAHRASYHRPYSDPALGRNVLRHAGIAYSRWRETLRYHKNRAYGHEVAQMRLAASWFQINARRL